MGTRLEISTAIFTNGIYTDKLMSEDLCIDAWQSETVLRIGRIFKALSLVNAELREFYASILHDCNLFRIHSMQVNYELFYHYI